MAIGDVDMGGDNLIVNTLKVGATAPGQAGTDIGVTDLTALAGVTAGTVAASKVVIVDASKNISTFGTVGSGAITSTGASSFGTIATGATTVTSASANALAVGLTGATNSAFSVDASTALQVAGLNVKGAVTGGTVAISTTDSGGANNLTINAKGTGTIGIGSVSTGAVTITPATTVTGALTNTGLLTANGGVTVAGATTTLTTGTATIAPLTFVSGTNLTTAAAGAMEFDGNAFYATSQASSRQMVDAEQYIIQATEPAADNNAGLDSASAAAVFTAGSGQVTLVAGKTYFFEGQYLLTNTGTTAHTWATAFGGTATFTALGTSYTVFGNSSGTANAAATGGLNGFLTGSTLSTAVVCTPSSTSATEQVVVQVMGTIVCANAGTLIPQMKASARPGASGTPGVTHKAGSFFRIWQAPTLGTVGNWS